MIVLYNRFVYHMKKNLWFSVSILFLLSLVSCNVLGGSLMEYLDEYTNNAALMSYDFSETYPRDYSDTVCMDTEGAVRLYMRNPKRYTLDFTYSFKEQSVQSYYNSNYPDTITITPADSGNGMYLLQFDRDFLQAIDEGNISGNDGFIKDISGQISISEHTTNRHFGTYDINVHADTVPTEIGCVTVMQDSEDYTNTGAQYYLCFKIEKSSSNNDFNTIRINSDSFSIQFQGGSTVITESAESNTGTLSTTADVSLYPVIEGGDDFSDSDSLHYDYFYYATGDIRTPSEKRYTVTLTDKAGLSASASITNKAEKLSPVTFTITDSTRILESSANSYIIEADNNGTTKIRITHPKTTTTAGTVKGNPQIVCSVSTAGSSNPVEYRGTSPLEIPLECGSTNTISAHAVCTNYISSEDSVSDEYVICHSPEYYVSSSADFASGNGTLASPFRTIQQCVNAIISDARSDEPDYFINVLSDITPHEQDYTDTSGFLISRRTFAGNMTIRGVNTNGSAVQRTIDGNGQPIINWGVEGTLNLKNLTLENGGYTGSGAYGPALTLFATHGKAFVTTMTDCIIKDCSYTYESSTPDSSNMPSAILFSGGYSGTGCSLTLKNCTITGNSVTGTKGGAVVFHSGAEFGTMILQGKNNITGNTYEIDDDEAAANIFLNANCILSVSGSIAGSTAGVTTAEIPEIGNSVSFLTYAASDKPSSGIFTSDQGYSINLGATEGRFAIGGGLITTPTALFDDVRIAISPDLIYQYGTNKSYTISFTDADDEAITPESWNAIIQCAGEDVPKSSSTWTLAASTKTVTLTASLPKAEYTLYTEFVYNGDSYSASFCLLEPDIMSFTEIPEEDCTIQISSASGLSKLSEWSVNDSLEGKTFELENDVTLPSSFTPIGSSTGFAGTFDGKGHKVSGLNASGDKAAFFGEVNGGTIKNLTVAGNSSMGGIVASSPKCTIQNCVSEVVISSGSARLGGILASTYYTGSSAMIVIEDCINKGSISSSGTGQFSGVGGIVGVVYHAASNSVIRNCINYGDISAPNLTSSYGAAGNDPENSVGGIVGISTGNTNLYLYNCSNYGNITGNNNAGGISGLNSSVYNSINYGTVTASNGTAGGIVGKNNKTISIKNCCNTGAVTGNEGRAGALFGYGAFRSMNYSLYVYTSQIMTDICSIPYGTNENSAPEYSTFTSSTAADAVTALNNAVQDSSYLPWIMVDGLPALDYGD